MKPTLDASYEARSLNRLQAERHFLLERVLWGLFVGFLLYAIAESLASALWLWRLNRELACAY